MRCRSSSTVCKGLLSTDKCCCCFAAAVEVDDSAFLDLMDGGEMMMESDDE